MKYLSLIVFMVGMSSCGIKGPPLPPLASENNPSVITSGEQTAPSQQKEK